jgi:hypothetical protein
LRGIWSGLFWHELERSRVFWKVLSAGYPLHTVHNAIRAAETALDMLDAMEMVIPQDRTFQRSLESSNAESIEL